MGLLWRGDSTTPPRWSNLVSSCGIALAAITLDDTATFASIRSNIFQFHTAHPIVTHANSVGALRLNTFVDNTPNAIRILAGEVTTSQVLSSMGVAYVVFGNLIEIGANAELAIDPGVTLKFESGTGITTETLQNGVGILRAIGTASNPILFTSTHDIPTRGDWRGISIISDNPGFITSVVEYCIIEYAGQGGNGAVFISDANPAIRHCSITNSSNDGIQKDASPQNIPIIMQNNIFDNQRFDINNQSTTQMPARSNWWGSSEGALSNNGDVEASGHLASPILLGTPRSPFSLLYPHFAAGDEWLTLLFFTNVEAMDAVVGAQFYDSSGNPAQVQIGSEIASDLRIRYHGGRHAEDRDNRVAAQHRMDQAGAATESRQLTGISIHRQWHRQECSRGSCERDRGRGLGLGQQRPCRWFLRGIWRGQPVRRAHRRHRRVDRHVRHQAERNAH